jgi:hypothetical protein
LNNLGYKTGPEELPIWRQFEIKHNLKWKKEHTNLQSTTSKLSW